MIIDDFKRWKVDVLRKYCQQRGLVIANSKRKEELVALAFAAYSQNMPVVPGPTKRRMGAAWTRTTADGKAPSAWTRNAMQ